MKLVAAAVANPRWAKRRTSINGSAIRSACHTNRATSVRPASSMLGGRAPVKVLCRAISASPYMKIAIPPQSSARPRTSSRSPARHDRQQSDGEQEGQPADGQVDEEHPAPTGGPDDCPADHRPEDGREQHGYSDDAHHSAHPLGPCRLGEDGLPERHDHSAAQALDDAKRDQRSDRPGQAGQQ
jgi:hypothetical protein